MIVRRECNHRMGIVGYRHFKKRGFLKRVVPGIYCYFYKTTPICLYVGATKNLYQRGLRYFRKISEKEVLATKIIKTINKNDLACEIYFYPKEKLKETEKRYIKHFKPIAQLLNG